MERDNKIMERNESKSATDEIKLKFVQRIMLLAFGCITACVLIAVGVPVLAFASGGEREAPIPQLADDRLMAEEVQASGPAPIELNSKYREFENSQFMNNFAIFIPITIFLSMVFLMGYALYDMFRLYLQYRKARDIEDPMFP